MKQIHWPSFLSGFEWACVPGLFVQGCFWYASAMLWTAYAIRLLITRRPITQEQS